MCGRVEWLQDPKVTESSHSLVPVDRDKYQAMLEDALIAYGWGDAEFGLLKSAAAGLISRAELAGASHRHLE